MFSAVFALGISPCDPRTAQVVCRLVTQSLRNPVFYPFSFQFIAHSCENENSTTRLLPGGSALFAQNTGGRYLPHDLPLVFKDLRTLSHALGVSWSLCFFAFQHLLPALAELCCRIPSSVALLCNFLPSMSRQSISVPRCLCGLSASSGPCFILFAAPCYPWGINHV